MKNKTIIIVLVILLIIILCVTIIVSNQEKEQQEQAEVTQIQEIKNETGATADTNIYQVGTEYDGREMLQVKPEVQMQAVWAGIEKNGSPTEEETNSLWESKPTETGIWVSPNSREKFLTILNDNEIRNFKINEEGYLYKEETSQSDIAKRIEEMINSNMIYIIDISGTCYIRDEMTGELVEYPFEKMDPYQVCEPYYYENNIILEITTNEAGKLTNQEILSAIVQY